MWLVDLASEAKLLVSEKMQEQKNKKVLFCKDFFH